MRKHAVTPRRNWPGFRLFFGLSLLFGLLIFQVTDSVRAAGDVTLTASAFSDTDAEDTFNASEWVIRDSSTTVYDQTAGAVTSVTVLASTFTSGATYYWKVRYQDQHLVWSDYSAESSFTYGSASTATPEPSVESSTVVPSPSVSPSRTPYPSPSPEPTTSCMFGWQLINGDWFCGDPQSPGAEILTPEDQIDFCAGDMVKVTYYYHRGQGISGGTGPMSLDEYADLMKERSGPVFDIYLSTDGGAVYTRIEHDFDPMPGATIATLPSADKGRAYSGAGNINFLKVIHYVKIPSGIVSDPTKTRLLVYAAYDRNSINNGDVPEGTTVWWVVSNDLGSSFVFNSSDGEFWHGSDVMDFTNAVQAKTCDIITPGPSATPGSECKSTITSPQKWTKGSTNRIAWASGFEAGAGDKTVNILVEKGDKTTAPIVMNQTDTGSYTSNYNPGNDSTVNLRLEQYVSKQLVSNCVINLRVSSDGGGTTGCTGAGCLPKKMDTILVLGSLIATILSVMMSTVSAFPAVSRVLGGLFNLASAPIWPGVGWPSGKQSWGMVYDTSTKSPIEKAVIRVFSAPSDRLRATVRTNKNGQFGFILPPGNYSLTASAAGYDFPTRMINTSTDGPYANLYRGGEFKVDSDAAQKAQINFNIPLDRVNVSTFDLVELKTLTAISKFFQVIRYPLLILGTLSTGYLVFTQGRILDYIFAGVYAAIWGWDVFNMLKKKTYGVVKDQQGSPISLAVIRVLDRSNRLKTTIVTGEDGKFQANLDPGEYRLDISRPGYKSVRTQVIKISNAQDIGRLDINLAKL